MKYITFNAFISRINVGFFKVWCDLGYTVLNGL